jgi:hypothetical protein
MSFRTVRGTPAAHVAVLTGVGPEAIASATDKADRSPDRPTLGRETTIKQLDADHGSRRRAPDPAQPKNRALAARATVRILPAQQPPRLHLLDARRWCRRASHPPVQSMRPFLSRHQRPYEVLPVAAGARRREPVHASREGPEVAQEETPGRAARRRSATPHNTETEATPPKKRASPAKSRRRAPSLRPAAGASLSRTSTRTTESAGRSLLSVPAWCGSSPRSSRARRSGSC